MSDTPLRVLSIAHSAVSADGGRKRYDFLSEPSDFDVDVLLPQRWQEFGRKMEADPPSNRPHVRYIPEPVALTAVPYFSWYLHFYPRLRSIITQRAPNVVHLWEEPWSLVALQAVMARKRAAIVLEVDQNILKRLPPPFEAIRRFVLGRTAVVLARSPDAADVVRACGFSGRILPIGYGVDQAVFHPACVKKSAGERLRIGYVGRLVEEKGLDDVLNALSLLETPVDLAIMGEGPYEPELRRKIGALGLDARVEFQGWGTKAGVAEFLRSLDLSLLVTRTTPSVREQFGRAIIESQACEVPVIGSQCGAIPDIVAEGGWIIGERSPEQLAALLRRLSVDRDEIARRGALGLSNVRERFTFEAVAAALEKSWRLADEIGPC